MTMPVGLAVTSLADVDILAGCFIVTERQDRFGDLIRISILGS